MSKNNKSNAIAVTDRLTGWLGTPVSVLCHSIFFVVMFLLPFFGWELEQMLLILTTVVSIEAIYLALFIQMSVNRNTQSLVEVEQSLDVVEESLEEVEESLEEVEEDIGGIEKDIDAIQIEDKKDTVLDKYMAETLKQMDERIAKLQEMVEILAHTQKKQ